MYTPNKDCRYVQGEMDSYVEGCANPADSTFIRAHSTLCPACYDALEKARATRKAVRSLSERILSSSFNDRLARRIAAIEEDKRVRGWTVLGPRSAVGWTAFARPSLAVAVTAISLTIGIVAHNGGRFGFGPQHREAVLVSQCVAQHQVQESADVVSDWSAANLTGRVNGLDPNGTDDSL